ERSSARETAMRVACCGVARQFLKHFGIEIGGHVLQIGSVGYQGWEEIRNQVDALTEQGAEQVFKAADKSEVRCLDEALSERMREDIKETRLAGSSLGVIYEIIVTGMPAGLRSYVHWGRKIDGQIAQTI